MPRNKFVYSKEELENMADSINRRFFSDRLIRVSALDPYDLVDRIGCDVEWKYISPDTSILGMTFFDDGVWPVWDSGTYSSESTFEKEAFTKGTIVVNHTVLDNKNEKTENWIVTHESSHWIKDQDFFANEAETTLQVCRNNDFNGTYWWRGMPTLELIERQTNYLTGAILMPREITKDRFFEICRYKNIPQHPIKFQNYLKGYVAKLAKEFNVNYNPMLYRLYDIEVIERPSKGGR